MLLLGIWKNVQDVEESLSLPELEVIATAAREKEMRHNKFLAALKGIDLDDEGDSAAEKVEEMKRRIELERYGAEAVERNELGEFGLDFETEEE